MIRAAGPACFSRSGWWQTLCGLDAANQGFGWTTDPDLVGCADCRELIARGEHALSVRPLSAILWPRAPQRVGSAS